MVDPVTTWNRARANQGNNVWNSLVHHSTQLVHGALQEVKTGTGIALHTMEYAVEQPVAMVRTLGNEIKQTIKDTKTTMVHLAILGTVGYFTWEFVASQRIMDRTMNWVEGLVSQQNKRQRIIY